MFLLKWKVTSKKKPVFGINFVIQLPCISKEISSIVGAAGAQPFILLFDKIQ